MTNRTVELPPVRRNVRGRVFPLGELRATGEVVTLIGFTSSSWQVQNASGASWWVLGCEVENQRADTRTP